MSMVVYLAYYHTGFIDDAPLLLAVCDSEKVATVFIEDHKKKRDEELECMEKARFWIKEVPLRRFSDVLSTTVT